jgi:hypothetical protein
MVSKEANYDVLYIYRHPTVATLSVDLLGFTQSNKN